MLHKVYRKIINLGIYNTFLLFHLKTQKKLFRILWKKRALKQYANHQWGKISEKHPITPSFETFFEKLKRNNFISRIINSPQFASLLPQKHSNIEAPSKKTEKAYNNCFTILGSQEICFENNKIPWQQDIKLALNKIELDNSKKFYQDIVISQSKNQSFDDYSYDIKVPWELSRMQHMFYLGKTYQITNDEKYAKTFKEQVENWIDKNPYLLGINWVGPMEVAIRSINLIWAFYFFKNSKIIPLSFWEKFVCSLYDHAHYLEYNSEKYPPTNNHYFSDLLGYLYLCTFFRDIKHFRKTQRKFHKEILKEIDKQIQNDGTIYEGSTNYHKLTTEILLHFHLLSKTNPFPIPSSFLKRFNKMLTFIGDCSDQRENLVQIGDNDSGKIITGIKIPQHSITGSEILKHYTNFGLSIIKTKNWHITFRHPTFNKNQPSGHFHEDELSITMSINGQPILVDPGTYLYTANKKCRNFMRSKKNHNKFFLVENNNNLDNQGTFELDRIPQQNTALITSSENEITITDHHKKHRHPIPYRQIKFDKNKETLKIEDWWKVDDKTPPQEIKGYWSFIFHPNIEVEKHNTGWYIKYQNSILLKMATSLSFTPSKGWYSPEYGTIKPCVKLIAAKNLNLINLEKQKIILELIRNKMP